MLTVQQVSELAPDAGSLKAGQGLAAPGKWTGLGRTDRAVWGAIKGSGAKPYQVRIDLTEPAFKCSCPSRKFPCKHSIGLLLILADKPNSVPASEPPAWVNDWLTERDQRQTRKAEQAEKRETIADPDAQARRAAQRETKVKGGIEELAVWLGDLVRQGLAAAQAQPPSYWEGVAARMVDAQAPGLARQVRLLAELAVSGEGWQHRLLSAAGRVYLLLEAYDRLETLPAELQQDVRTAIGWTTGKEDVLSQTPVGDRWLVMGQRVEEEDRLRVQRTWLWGRQTGRPALILSFAAGPQAFDLSFVVGSEFQAELVYYPSAVPIRALVKERPSNAGPIGSSPEAGNIDQTLAGYTDALSRCPWIDTWPMLLGNVVPHIEVSENGVEHWQLIDAAGAALPLSARFTHGWELLAVSGGEPIGVFGEWDGQRLLPWSAWSGGRFFSVVRSEDETALARFS